MKNNTLRVLRVLSSTAAAAAIAGAGLFAQSVPELTYDANADILTLPSSGEVAGVATNSKGHMFVYARTGHAVATLGDERTFYHGGSRLFQFDQNGKFVKEIGQGVYAVNFAQQVRVDPQDNVWIVDAGSNQVVKFDADGRYQLVLGRKPENIPLRAGPAVPARVIDVQPEGAAAGGRGGAEGGRGGGGGRGNNESLTAKLGQAKNGLTAGMSPADPTVRAYTEVKAQTPRAIADLNAAIATAATLSTALAKYNVTLTAPAPVKAPEATAPARRAGR